MSSGAFDGGFRVPFIAHWPAGGLHPNLTLSTPAHGTDIFPTLLAAAGVPLPTDRVIDGVDLLPLLRSRDGESSNDQALVRRVAHSAVPLRAGGDGAGVGHVSTCGWPAVAGCAKGRSLHLHVRNSLAAVLTGQWKLHLPHMIDPAELVRSRWLGDHARRNQSWLWLTDLERDPEEAYDSSARHLELAQQLADEARRFEAEFEANPRGVLRPP